VPKNRNPHQERKNSTNRQVDNQPTTAAIGDGEREGEAGAEEEREREAKVEEHTQRHLRLLK